VPGQCKLPRYERLRRKKDFLSIYEQGRRRRGANFACYVVRREGQGRKFGIAVSRKIGKAVARNRVKRYVREFYRLHRGQIPEDIHLVLVAQPGASQLNYRQCHDAIRRLLQEEGVLDG